jgi:hypothetical protein
MQPAAHPVWQVTKPAAQGMPLAHAAAYGTQVAAQGMQAAAHVVP